MMGGTMFGGFGGFGLLGMFINLAISIGFLVLLAWGVVWIVRQFSGGSNSVQWTGPRNTIGGEVPEQILRQRLARGEIDETEYERLRQVLNN